MVEVPLFSVVRMYFPASLISFYRTSFFVSAIKFLGLAVSFLGSVLLARVLGPEDRGVVFWICSWAAMGAVLASFGITQVGPQLVAVFSRSSGFLLLRFCGFSLIGLVLILPIFWILGLSKNFDSSHSMLVWGGFLMALTLASFVLEALLVGLRYFRIAAGLSFAWKVFPVGLFYISYVLGSFDVERVLGLYVVAYALSLLLVFLFLRPRLVYQSLSFSDLSFAIGRGRYFFANYIGHVAMAALLYLPSLILGYYSSSEDIGYFAVAFSVIEACALLSLTVAYNILPYLRDLHPSLRRQFQWGVFWILALLLSVGSGIAFFVAQPFFLRMFGESFSPAISVFVLLLPGMVGLGLLRLCQSMISAASRGYHSLVAPCLACLLFLAGVFQGAMGQGAQAIACVWSISLVGGMIVALLLLRFSSSVRDDPLSLESPDALS